jgi:DNA adenine methylase
MIPKIKSPLRYPGGKQKALRQIIPYIPENIGEYREPFIGGGSVFLAIQQLFANKIDKYWINDLNFDLYCFWVSAQNEIKSMVEQVDKIKQKNTNGRELYNYLTADDSSLSDFERAVRFFVLNRITFSGTVDSGGYSQQAYEKRFTNSSIERLLKLSSFLASVQITNDDYETLLFTEGENVFILIPMD